MVNVHIHCMVMSFQWSETSPPRIHTNAILEKMVLGTTESARRDTINCVITPQYKIWHHTAVSPLVFNNIKGVLIQHTPHRYITGL